MSEQFAPQTPAFLTADISDYVSKEGNLTILRLEYPIELKVRTNGQEQQVPPVEELRFRRPTAGDLEDFEGYISKKEEMASMRIVMANMLQDQQNINAQMLRNKLDAEDFLRMCKVFADFFPNLFRVTGETSPET